MCATKPILYHLPLGITTYSRAALIQESLVSLHLAYKPHLSRPRYQLSGITPAPLPPSLPPLPPPTIITSEFSPPVYTSGIRQQRQVPSSEKYFLTRHPHPITGEYAEFVETRRGGRISWHGKGQCTIYAIADLRTLLSHHHHHHHHSSFPTQKYPPIGVRDWIHTLEGVTIDLLRSYGVTATRDHIHPGVWARRSKIAAVGVRLRRYITHHGVGMNVCTDPWWWERVVACGITGRGVTDLRREMYQGAGRKVPAVEEIGEEWVQGMAERLGRSVRVVRVEDVLGFGWEDRVVEGEEGRVEWKR